MHDTATPMSVPILVPPPNGRSDTRPTTRPISRRLQQVGDRSNWHCTYCGRPLDPDPDAADDLDAKPTIDHLVPRSKGGGNRLRNQVLACHLCNTVKGNTDLPDWLAGLDLPTDLRTSRAVIAHTTAARADLLATLNHLARTARPAPTVPVRSAAGPGPLN